MLAESGFTLCNGGYDGTMAAAARAATEAGGETVGVTMAAAGPIGPNPWIHHKIRCASLPERICRLLQEGDAYVILPGGTGTLAEIGLMLDLANKHLMRLKPIVFVGAFWQPLLDLLACEPVLREQSNRRGVKGVSMRGQVACADDVVAAVHLLQAELDRAALGPDESLLER
jgi:uncharacterized protein (TIGR00725 family)